MAFTEFYCQNGGSNLNAGSTTNNTAAYTSTNGNWSTTTHIFTPTDGSTPASSVNVGDWASIYVDASSVGVYIVRITAVAAGVNGGITTSTTAIAGTAPTTSATARTIKVGGAWQGPNGAVGFPLTLSTLNTLNNASGDMCRINFKNDQTYSISSAITCASTTFVMQGYTSTVGDGGRATIDTSTNVIKALSMTGQSSVVADFIFVTTQASGSGDLASDSSSTLWLRCVFHGARGNGLALGNTGSKAVECEAYDNNKSNTVSKGGFFLGLAGATCYRCISHDNTGSNTAGFLCQSGGGILINCIADTNGGKGINLVSGSNSTHVMISACDLYNNGSDGIGIASGINTMTFWIENCNLIKNAGKAINVTSTNGAYSGWVYNCGYGAGTQANGSADTLGALVQAGTVTYASNVTPWNDPANGDFRVNLNTAMGAGRGAFTETAASYAGTIGYPDIGAAQHIEITTGTTAAADVIYSDGFVGHAYVITEDTKATSVSVSVIAGALPTGLSLTNPAVGVFSITGTPTTVGTFDFTLRIQVGATRVEPTAHITIHADPDEGTGGVGGS